jgi:cell division protein FtsN
MGELSESLKKISLGSILVVVGIISILSLGIYWYVFTENPSSITGIVSAQAQRHQGSSQTSGSGSLSNTPARPGPDNRTVIVETPSSGTLPLDTGSLNKGSAETSSGIETSSSEASVKTGNLSIQVGAFSKAGGAEKLADELDNKGFSYLISSADGMYRVFVGDFTSKNQASEVLEKLKQSGFSGFVRAIP